MERENASTVVEDFLVEDKRAQTDSKKIWRKEDRFLPWIPLRHKMTEPVSYMGLMANVSRLARLWQDLLLFSIKVQDCSLREQFTLVALISLTPHFV